MRIHWSGEGVEERGIDAKTGRTVVRIDPRYFRPAEVDTLLGDPTRAETELGWRRTVSFAELVREMAQHDLVLAERDSHMQARGYPDGEPARMNDSARPFSRYDTIYVAGHRGLAGSAICRALKRAGYVNVIGETHARLDLTQARAVDRYFDEARPSGGGARRGARRRHHREFRIPGGVHPRQSAHADQRHRRGVSLRRLETRVPGLELHLSEVRPAAHARGIPVHGRRSSPPTRPMPSPSSPASRCARRIVASTASMPSACCPPISMARTTISASVPRT